MAGDYESNVRKIVCAIESTPIHQLCDLMSHYSYLEDFCRNTVMQDYHSAEDYKLKSQAVLPKVEADNANYRQDVGDFLYPFVCNLVGRYIAPQVTAMIDGLPLDELKLILTDWSHLLVRVQ